MTDNLPERQQFRVTATPYLCASDATSAIEFYQRAFAAIEVVRLIDERGRVSHAEIAIEGASIMISDEHPEIGVISPTALGNSPVMIVLDVADVDALFGRAVAAGATVDRPVADQFDGELRNGKLIDPFGHRWMIMTRKQARGAAEMQIAGDAA